MKAFAILVAVIAGAWVFVAFLFGNPTYTYRYRLTLEVEADGQTYSGSSVVAVAEYMTSKLNLDGGMVHTSVGGEATVVELDRGRVLVALLEGVAAEARAGGKRNRLWIGPAPDAVLFRAYGLPDQMNEWRQERNPGLAELIKNRGIRELDQNELPTLISFRDTTDPSSVFVVDPSNLASLGVRMRRATIEITDAKVTRSIGQKLPWLSTTPGYLSGNAYCEATEMQRTGLPFCPDRSHLVRGKS